MFRRFRILCVILVLTLAALAARAEDYGVSIYDFYFYPTNISIVVGDTVTWTNKVLRQHDTTARAGAWASSLLQSGNQFPFTFLQPGAYPYVCQTHVGNFPQQTGLVTVASIPIPPTISITNPANGSVLVAPANFAIGADASDSDGVIAQVEFFVNGNSVAVFGGPPFTTNLTGLDAGNYLIAAVAIDNEGQMATNTVSITVQQFEPTTFTLHTAVEPATAGSIFVTPPGESGVYLAGITVALAAQPAAGYRFVEWTNANANTSANNPLLFVMDADKTVTAIFEPIPPLDFNTVSGVFTGLLVDERETEYTTSGFLFVRVTKTGRYSGMSNVGGIRQFMAGQFDRFGYAPLVLRRGSLSGSLQIDAAGQRMTGSITSGTNSPSPTLLLYRTAAKTNAAVPASLYVVEVGAEPPVASSGAASVQIFPHGAVRMRGNLGDGSVFAQRTFLSPDGRIPVFVPLYHNRGAMLGWLEVGEDGMAQGMMRWFRPGDSRSVKYPQGFALKISVVGSLVE